LTRAADIVDYLRGRILADEQRVGYQGRSANVYDELIETLTDAYNATPSHDLLERLFESMERAKARVLAELLADLPIPPPADAPPELIERERLLLAEVDRLQRALEAGTESPLPLLDRLADSSRQLEETWAAIVAADPHDGPKYLAVRRAERSSCAATRAMLRASGSSRVAFVNFYVSPSRIVSVTLFSDRELLHFAEHKVARSEVRALVLVNPETPPAPDVRLEYWELDFPAMTVAPIAEAVAGYDIVCLSPHDLLHSLPLHAFRPDAGRPRFLEGATIAYAPSAAVLGVCLRAGARNSGENLVLGNPARADQVQIPHAGDEAQAVAALLQCEPLIGAAATRSVALERGARAQYLHFACHCKFSPTDPMESAMMFSDGDLSARDILSWRVKPALVTVSACESGVSKIEGGDELFGVVRALLFAGSPAVLVSLWNAYDATAAAMMKHFYELHVTNKMPKAAALADAQRTQVRGGVSAAQWASFVLIGDWR
jgi:hypothetical protein